jgi:hypothetical protein
VLDIKVKQIKVLLDSMAGLEEFTARLVRQRGEPAYAVALQEHQGLLHSVLWRLLGFIERCFWVHPAAAPGGQRGSKRSLGLEV